jgi:hypothetical protein
MRSPLPGSRFFGDDGFHGVKLTGSLGIQTWIAALLFCQFGSQLASAVQSAALGWTASPDPRTTGYVVVYGTVSGAYTQSTNVGNVTQATIPGLTEGRTYYFSVYAYGSNWSQSDLANEVPYQTRASVVSRLVFYNHSAWDGNDASANGNDDAAIAPDKTPLLPGGIATFGNYTSYSRGLNGIMVDIAGLNGATPTASDFTFNIGDDDNPASWPAAPAPSSITVRSGAGIGGSDRVTLIWTDNAVQKSWLRVAVLATPSTRLASSDTFYFGNAIGETGNSPTDAYVDGTDESKCSGNPHGFLNPAGIDCPYDFNRDKLVDGADISILRANATGILTALRLINLGYALTEYHGATISGGSLPASKVYVRRAEPSASQAQSAMPSRQVATQAAQLGVLSCERREGGKLEIQILGDPAHFHLQLSDRIDQRWRDAEAQPFVSAFDGGFCLTVPIHLERAHQFYRISIDDAAAK